MLPMVTHLATGFLASSVIPFLKFYKTLGDITWSLVVYYSV